MTDSQSQIRIAAANEFNRSPALQAEFTSEAVYVAYRCAMARGAARIYGKTSAASAAPGQSHINIAPGRSVQVRWGKS
ncbi:MAG: hypothetical protein KJ889_01645 [Gammaproteobacteria bacterium]|nr:hypothetical protein [Gammaproteobacteria bacterium]